MVVAIDAHKLVYTAIPKAACTSVKAALLEIDPETPEKIADLPEPDAVHRVYPTRRYHRRRRLAYRDHFWFSVVRDPLKRMLSVYTDRIAGRNELRNSTGMARQTELPRAPDPDTFFQNLDGYRRAASVVKHHTLPYRLFLSDDPSHFDRIYTVGDLPRLAADLSERTGREVTIPRFNQSRGSLTLDDLQPGTRAALRRALAGDYALLSGIYDTPF